MLVNKETLLKVQTKKIKKADKVRYEKIANDIFEVSEIIKEIDNIDNKGDKMEKSLFEKVMELNLEYSYHESDLYLIVNDESIMLIDDYEYKENVTKFKSAIDGRIMYDIPFAYQPYWDKKAKKEGI